MNITEDSIKSAYAKMGYKWGDIFNIFGVRAKEARTNTFNDYVGYWLRTSLNDEPEFKVFEATTDPGFEKGGVAVPDGTCSLKAGFYPNLYHIDFHRGDKSHPCFRQIGKGQYYKSGGGMLYNPDTLFWGIIGSNIHSTRPDFTPEKVDNWSKACLVVKRWKSHLVLIEAGKRSGLKVFDLALFQESEVISIP